MHLVGGLFGTLMVGLVATKEAPAAVSGLFYGGGTEQLVKQAIGAFAVLGYRRRYSYLGVDREIHHRTAAGS